MNYTDRLQRLLPFGYLFLIVLGIIKESIYFYQLGINALNYSTLMDVLISPIADLTSHPIILGALIPLLAFGMFLRYNILKKNDKKWVKALVKKDLSTMSDEEINQESFNFIINFSAMMMLSFFLGIGIGSGRFEAQKIKDGKIKFKHNLTFNTGETKNIHLIKSNSAYYFYVEKGSPNIKISPVGTIKTLELSDNKSLK